MHDVNDELASVCGTHPQHFSALAGLPLADIDAAVAELERARTRLQLRGAILPCNYFLSLTRMERLHPVLEAASRLGAHLMIHSGLRHDEDLAPHVYDDLTMHRASTIDLHTAISHATLTLMHADLAALPRCQLPGGQPRRGLAHAGQRMDHIVMTRARRAPPLQPVRRTGV